MKREILFKAICIETGKWVYGFYWVEKFKEFPHVHHIIETYKDKKGFHQHGKQVHPETVCQFTGLLDKNGNKIFEGDEVNVSPLTKSGRIEIVKYLYVGGFLSIHPFQSDVFHWSSLESEITGNIHDK